MEKKLITKMTRYIELSKTFSKSDRDILSDRHGLIMGNGTISNGTSSICIGTNTSISSIRLGDMQCWMLDGKEIYIDDEGNVKAKDPKKPLTRGEEYKAKEIIKADKDAKLMDEYDEYIELRKSLTGYFEGLNTLLND